MKTLKDIAQSLKKGLNQVLPTGLLVLGAAAVSCGFGLFCFPVGIIAAGVSMIALGALIIKGGGSDE